MTLHVKHYRRRRRSQLPSEEPLSCFLCSSSRCNSRLAAASSRSTPATVAACDPRKCCVVSERPSPNPVRIRLWDYSLIDSHCSTLSGERSYGFIPYDSKDIQISSSGDNRPPHFGSLSFIINYSSLSFHLPCYDNNHTQMYIINYLPPCQMWFFNPHPGCGSSNFQRHCVKIFLTLSPGCLWLSTFNLKPA